MIGGSAPKKRASPAEAHPSTWAPFVVVGEGGASADAPTTQVISPGAPPGTTLAASKTKPSKKSAASKGSDWKGTIWRGGGMN